MITAVFVIVESLVMQRNRCFLGLNEIIMNMTALNTTYNRTTWFVLPYCVLVMFSQLLFKIIDRISPVMTLLLSFGVYVASSYMNHRFVWFGANVFQTFYILFPFVLGALVAKYGVIDKAKAAMNNRHLALPYLLLFLLLTIRYFVYSGAFAALFATIFIMLFVCADKPKWLEMTLMHLGKASFYMWLVHAWICWYLLRDEIYGLENPLLIFCATTLLSYVLALIFHSLTNPILKKM